MNNQGYTVYWWNASGQHAMHYWPTLREAAAYARGAQRGGLAVLVVPEGDPVGLWRSRVSAALFKVGEVGCRGFLERTANRTSWGGRAA